MCIKNKANRQKGVIIVMTALLLPVMLACAGVAFDFGRLYMEKARMQNIVDAAALAGLVEFKQHEHYVDGTGRLVDRIPLAAVKDNTLSDEFLERINAAADEYLIKNAGDEFRTGSDRVKVNVYRLVTEEDTSGAATKYTYYYEMIIGRYFPVTFSRIVYPHDIEVRTGAICKVDINDVRDKLTYAKAREMFGSIANVPMANVLAYDSSDRLDADIEALTNLANYLKDKSKSEIQALLGRTSVSNSVLGHYEETVGVNSYTKTLMEMDTFFKALTNNPDEVYDATKRYLFSDYALQNRDGVKAWITYSGNAVTKVRIAINPADTANGSGPLSVTVGE